MTQRPNVGSTTQLRMAFMVGMDILLLGLAPLSLMAAALAYSGLMIIAMRR
ncbi:hypothetical protein [Methylobacterium thuringiense]|nr:hypothetical protein [Methylobacterium thuringiense]